MVKMNLNPTSEENNQRKRQTRVLTTGRIFGDVEPHNFLNTAVCFFQLRTDTLLHTPMTIDVNWPQNSIPSVADK